MVKKHAKAQTSLAISADTRHVIWCIIGIGVGIIVTIAGCGLALAQKTIHSFLHEWFSLEGFFLIAIGTWLWLIVRSGSLRLRIARLTTDKSINLGIMSNKVVRSLVVCSISIIGTTSLIGMGFNAHGVMLIFMWVICAFVCLTAAFVTLHLLEILAAVHNLQKQNIKVFRYAPASTPELRSIVRYFSSFTLLMTIGYAFSLIATFKGNWLGSKDYIEFIRLFWPLIYVPICSVALIYPHVIIHKLIQREKENTLLLCQQNIDQLLSNYNDLKTEEIDQTNTLAQLFDRITATPNYVVDVGIAVQAILPLAFNLLTLFIKFALGQS